MSERTMDGLAAARARGRTGGQKPKLGSRQVKLAQGMYEETGPDGHRAHTVAPERASGPMTSAQPTARSHTSSDMVNRPRSLTTTGSSSIPDLAFVHRSMGQTDDCAHEYGQPDVRTPLHLSRKRAGGRARDLGH